jgi:hypothetical protein
VSACECQSSTVDTLSPHIAPTRSRCHRSRSVGISPGPRGAPATGRCSVPVPACPALPVPTRLDLSPSLLRCLPGPCVPRPRLPCPRCPVLSGSRCCAPVRPDRPGARCLPTRRAGPRLPAPLGSGSRSGGRSGPACLASRCSTPAPGPCLPGSGPPRLRERSAGPGGAGGTGAVRLAPRCSVCPALGALAGGQVPHPAGSSDTGEAPWARQRPSHGVTARLPRAGHGRPRAAAARGLRRQAPARRQGTGWGVLPRRGSGAVGRCCRSRRA